MPLPDYQPIRPGSLSMFHAGEYLRKSPAPA